VVELLELFGEQTIELANSARLPYVTALAKTFLGTSRPRLRSTERRLRFGKKIHYTLLQDHRLWSPIPRAALGSTQKLKNEAFQRFFVVSKRCPARCQSITTPNVCKPNPRSLQSWRCACKPSSRWYATMFAIKQLGREEAALRRFLSRVSCT
jgi:hypothetical protein